MDQLCSYKVSLQKIKLSKNVRTVQKVPSDYVVSLRRDTNPNSQHAAQHNHKTSWLTTSIHASNMLIGPSCPTDHICHILILPDVRPACGVWHAPTLPTFERHQQASEDNESAASRLAQPTAFPCLVALLSRPAL